MSSFSCFSHENMCTVTWLMKNYEKWCWLWLWIFRHFHCLNHLNKSTVLFDFCFRLDLRLDALIRPGVLLQRRLRVAGWSCSFHLSFVLLEQEAEWKWNGRGRKHNWVWHSGYCCLSFNSSSFDTEHSK